MGKILLGTRFCRQIGFKTVNDQIDDEAGRRHTGLSIMEDKKKKTAGEGFDEDRKSLEAAIKGFILSDEPEPIVGLHYVSKEEGTAINVDPSELADNYLTLIKNATQAILSTWKSKGGAISHLTEKEEEGVLSEKVRKGGNHTVSHIG